MPDDTFTQTPASTAILGAQVVDPTTFRPLPKDDDAELKALCDEQGYLPDDKAVANALKYSSTTYVNVSESVANQTFAIIQNITEEFASVLSEIQSDVHDEIEFVAGTVADITNAFATVAANEFASIAEEVALLRQEVNLLAAGGAAAASCPGFPGGSASVPGMAAGEGGTPGTAAATATAGLVVEREEEPALYPGYPIPPGVTPPYAPPLRPISPPGVPPRKFPQTPPGQLPLPYPAPIPPSYPRPIGVPHYDPRRLPGSVDETEDCSRLMHLLGEGSGWPEQEIPLANAVTATVPSEHPAQMDYSPVEIAAAGFYRGTMAPLINVFRDPPGAPCDWRERSAYDYAAYLNGLILGG